MATTDSTILDRVRAELAKDEPVGSSKLFQALGDEGMLPGDLTRAQFHGRYVLPVMRERKRAEGGSTATRKPRKSTRKKAGAAKGTRAGAPTRTPRAPRAAAGAATGNGAAGDESSRIRGIFHRFAEDLAGARSRGELVKMLVRIDDYVRQVVKRPGR